MYFLPTLNTLVFSDLPSCEHPFLSNRYVTTLATFVQKMKLFVYYNDKFITISTLCLLQSAYQVQATNRQQNHTKFYIFYLFLTI
jgi:hypothetical protein